MLDQKKILNGYIQILKWLMLGAIFVNIITLFVPAFYAESFLGATYKESGITFLGLNFNYSPDANPLGFWCVESLFLNKEVFWQIIIKLELALMLYMPTVMPLLIVIFKKNIPDELLYTGYKYTLYKGSINFSFVFNSIYMITAFLLCFIKLNEWNLEPVVTYTYIPWIIQLGVFIAGKVIHDHCNRALQGEVAPLRTVSQNIDASPKPEQDAFNENDKVELLIKYKELFDNGVLTEEEYQQKKQEIMNAK